MTIFRLIAAALLPVLFAIFFYILEKKTKFAKFPYFVKQIIIGIVFGGIAVLATEFGIAVEDAVLNVRNAAPLTAGLLFGGPAGIIAGLIGGIHRWFCVLWGSAGTYTRLACSLATVFAGFFGAACRKLMFDNKKTSWFYGFALGVTTEVLHMLLLFLTNMNDIDTAFTYVAKCAMPMIIANSLSVMLSLLLVSLIGKEKLRKPREKKQIAQIFQFLLLICVIVAFFVTSGFTYSLQTKISVADADQLLRLNLEDVKADITDASDANLLDLTRRIADDISILSASAELSALAKKYNVSEINIVGQNGIIQSSSRYDFIGFDMNSGEQSKEFLVLLNGATEFVQEYQPISFSSELSMKYAGVSIQGGGFVQVGYNSSRFQKDIADHVKLAARNRHIGTDGFVMICDEQFNVVSSPYEEHIGTPLQFETDNTLEEMLELEGQRFEAKGRMEYDAYCMFIRAEGYFIIASIPIEEAMFSRNIAVYVLAFMEILVFASLFICVYFLIKNLVVDNIHKVNASLAKITDGDLNITVNVRGNEEFASLSDDINSTVKTLKHYIAEAAARIDKELEFAKAIQHSALPSVFPPYPSRRDFSIYASMYTAKEVGGDFYDFYLLNDHTLIFLIADVSGKGIPAAMFMMTAKTIIKSLAESGMEIDEVFSQANTKLCHNNEAGMFVTAWMGSLDLQTGILSYVNAGHNPPLIRKAGGNFEYLKTRPNFVLAGMDGARYRKHELRLDPDDTIYLYTDGVTEATNTDTQLYGEERLLKLLCNSQSNDPKYLCMLVKDDVDLFVGSAPQFDDITMLSVKLDHIQTHDSIITYPKAESLQIVADFLGNKLKEWDISLKSANRVHIALDEIYSNIIHYSGATRAEVTCIRLEGLIKLIFKDNGTPYDPTALEDPDITLSAEEREFGGLGIFMVRKSARDMNYTYVDGLNCLVLTFEV